ncbi:ribosomal protein S18-alanine N-acetyltransferase [Actinoplanes couchii]|nr:ribosomal protein S18-alanine N-acetyltransferase [Actinoplanes couchii]
MPIEEDLFGPEKWSPAMFWNELATRQFYLVALSGPGESAVSGAGRRADDRAGAVGEVGAGQRVDGAGGSVVGYAGLSVVDEHESWVQNIAVRREAQRLGIGRGLLEALLGEAARRGTRKTLLEVAVDNAPAQKLYATYGFEPVGIRRGYYQPSNTDALVMMRDA